MEPRSTKLIKSPLRYPGGKQRLARTLVSMLPQDIKEYREPFVGGGHVFVLLRQARPDVKVWINDNNPDLIAFWRQAQKDSEALTRRILPFVDVENKRDLFHALKNQTVDGEEDRAVRFFILNRLAYGGNYQHSSFSPLADRFNKNHVLAIAPLSRVLENVIITRGDYEYVVFGSGNRVALYCDPPYKTNAKFYGLSGFDFDRFFDSMKKCAHRWVITINAWDQSINFARAFWYKEKSVTYSIRPKRVSDLIIANYEFDGAIAPDREGRAS